MPDATLEAFDDHGTLARTVDADLDGAQRGARRAGRRSASTSTTSPRRSRTRASPSFSKSFDELLGTLEAKAPSSLGGLSRADAGPTGTRCTDRSYVVDDVAGEFAERVIEAFHAARTTRSRIALSGGETARRCYERLADDAGTQIDWWKVDVYWGDERCVPLDDHETRTTAWPARRCSTGSARPTPPTRCAATRARPLPAARRRARPLRPRPPRPRPRRPHRVAVPRARRRSTPTPAGSWCMNDDPLGQQPAPAHDAHLRRHRPGPPGDRHRVPARRRPRRWPGSRPATDRARRRTSTPSGWSGWSTRAAAGDLPRRLTSGTRRSVDAATGRGAAMSGSCACRRPARPDRSSELPLDELHGPGPCRPRRAARHAGHLLAQGLHPAHDAVPRQVRLLHVRPAAGPPRVALPHARAGAAPSPGPGAAAGCHEALFTLGERPEERYPAAARVARRARLRLDRRLPGGHGAAGARRDGPAPPRQRRRALPPTSSPRCGRCRRRRG